MTLGLIGLLLPIGELATVMWLVSRIAWKRYPALLVYLTIEAVAQTATILSWYVPAWIISQPVRMAVRMWVVIEVYRLSCVELDSRQRVRAIVTGLSACAAGTFLVAAFVRLSPFGSVLVFRQYFHIVLAAALLGLVWWVRGQEICENQDHRVYRHAMTANAVRMAVGACFVPGGFGYMVLPYTRTTWRVMDVALWAGALAIVLWLARGMTSNISCLRPEVAYRRSV